jgi:hypothetical protein
MASDSRNADDSPDLTTLLERLCASGVEFILVGGLAAVSQGAPVTTFDTDIVPSLDEANLGKLLDLLAAFNTRYRGRPAGQILRPTHADLAAGGHCLLMTDLGPLDVLGEIEGGLKFEALLDDAIEIPFRDHGLRVLSLEALVRMKRKSSREKDRAQLAVLEETLKRKP